MTRLSTLAGAALIVGAFAGLTCAQTAPVSIDASGRVTLTATDTPLVDLLRELARHERLELRVAPADRARPVRVTATNLSPYDAVMLVLKASGANFVVTDHRGPQGLIARVWVGALSSAPPLLEAMAADPDRPPAPAAAPPAADAPPFTHQEDHDRPKRPPTAGGGVPGRGTASAVGQAPGEVDGARLLQMLAGERGAARGDAVELPFPGPNGRPLTVSRESSTPRGFVELPFPDAAGRPLLEQIAPSGVPSGWVELPFPGPDGSPLRVPSAPVSGTGPAQARPPGR